MPIFRVIVINADFRACADHDFPSIDDARRQGIKAALAMGADEVHGGKPFFGAEVRVEDGGETVSRFIVSIGASPLQRQVRD